MRGGHGCTRNGVGRVVAADPGGLNVETRGKDIVAFSVVGKVSTLVSQSRGTDSHGLLGSGWRVAAGIGIVIASSDGKVNANINSCVDSLVKGRRLATTQAHVGRAALEALTSLTFLSGLDGRQMSLGGNVNTLDDIRHGAGTVGPQDLDSFDMGLLRNAVLLAGRGTGAVSSVAIAIFIRIVCRDSLAPCCTALEVDVINVSARVDNVDIDTLATISCIQVLVEGTEVETRTV